MSLENGAHWSGTFPIKTMQNRHFYRSKPLASSLSASQSLSLSASGWPRRVSRSVNNPPRLSQRAGSRRVRRGTRIQDTVAIYKAKVRKVPSSGPTPPRSRTFKKRWPLQAKHWKRHYFLVPEGRPNPLTDGAKHLD